MGVEKKIKERVSDAVAKSYYKPWYKRLSGRIFLTIVALVLILVVYFGVQVAIGYYHASKGETFNSALGVWLSQDEYEANNKLAADIMTGDDPWQGAENPIVNIVVFESFACPFCKGDQEDIKKLINTFSPLIRFTVKDFPTEGIHPGVFEAHLAADCAKEQDVYWQYHDLLFEHQDDFSKKNLKLLAKNLGINISQFDQCLDDEKYATEVRQDYADGVDLGVEGTPTYVVNGSLIPGSISYEVWEEIIGYIIKGGA